MRQNDRIYMGVGVVAVSFLVAVLFLTIYGSDFNIFQQESSFSLRAKFDNVSGVHINSPIRIAGVHVGRVKAIRLDNKTYQAEVSMAFSKKIEIPVDSSVMVYTDGLLGGRYLSITAGFSDDMLNNNQRIEHANSGLVLEEFLANAVNAMRKKND